MTDRESRPSKMRVRAVRAGACCAALAAVAVLTASCSTTMSTAAARTPITTAKTTGVHVVAGHTASDAARQLCHGRQANRIMFRRLVVTLDAAIPANASLHSARRWTVTSATKMRRVQRALCALPKPPKGIYHCPADLGISYRLRYHSGSGVLPAVTAHATGCELVTGLGKATRWAAESPGFWPTLGRAIGIAHPRTAASITP